MAWSRITGRSQQSEPGQFLRVLIVLLSAAANAPGGGHRGRLRAPGRRTLSHGDSETVAISLRLAVHNSSSPGQTQTAAAAPMMKNHSGPGHHDRTRRRRRASRDRGRHGPGGCGRGLRGETRRRGSDSLSFQVECDSETLYKSRWGIPGQLITQLRSLSLDSKPMSTRSHSVVTGWTVKAEVLIRILNATYQPQLHCGCRPAGGPRVRFKLGGLAPASHWQGSATPGPSRPAGGGFEGSEPGGRRSVSDIKRCHGGRGSHGHRLSLSLCDGRPARIMMKGQGIMMS